MAFPVPRPSFRTSITNAVAAAATTVPIDSTSDDDGNDLNGLVMYFTVEKGTDKEEFIVGTVNTSASTLTSVSYLNISDGEIGGSGLKYGHRAKKSVEITAFAYLTDAIRALNGTQAVGGVMSNPSSRTISDNRHIVDKEYADGVAIAGASDAGETTKGIVELATSAETIAGTDIGATSAYLMSRPSHIARNQQNGSFIYATSTTGNDTYVITLVPAITAYANGQVFAFKPDTANTGACTLNVNALGAKTIKKFHDQDLETGDIEANQIVVVAYNSTADVFELLSPVSSALTTAQATELGTFSTNYDLTAMAKSDDIQEFTASGTWTKPTGAKSVEVIAIGSGGGGGGGAIKASPTDGWGGTGGGGGGARHVVFNAANVASSITVTVGVGGTGGAAATGDSSGNNGSSGSVSTFGALVQAGGGGGGVAGGTGSELLGGCGGGHTTATQNTSPGIPSAATGSDGIGLQGTKATTATNANNAEWGGATGGNNDSSTGSDGGSSIYGGAGGGAGGTGNNGGAGHDGGWGGTADDYTTGGGGVGGGAGTSGTAGSTFYNYGGEGGGGGGGNSSGSVVVGNGANGGRGCGGGGGGGISSSSGSVVGVVGSSGGNGGDGYILVITHF